MNVELMFPARFIKSVEFGGKEPTLEIASVDLEDLESTDGVKKRKGIVKFTHRRKDGTTAEWVLNRTNAMALVAMFGSETDAWAGRRVTLYAAPYQGDTTCIRVRGSPDIDKDMTFELRLPRKTPQQVKLKKTPAKETP